MTTSLVFDIVVIFIAAFLGGLLADRLKQSPVVGYILGGILVGPYALGLVSDAKLVHDMSELGIILLMFTLGIEFSLSRLERVRNVAVIGGALQILLTIAGGALLGHVLGFTVYQSVFLGCALSISSTMIVMRTLSDHGELNTVHGQIMLGILIVQDLSVIIMVSLLPALQSTSGQSPVLIISAVVKTLAFVVLMLYLARIIVPAVLDRAARSSSNETFLLLALSLGLGVAAFAHLIGLSVSLGAFLAGLVISESEYTHEIMGKVVSFRDAFVVLFFVAVGMMIDPKSIAPQWLASLIVLGFIIFGKLVIVFAIIRAFQFHSRIAFYCAMGLLQTGEFSIVLAQIGLGEKLIPASLYNIILATAVISILLTPFLISAAPGLYFRLKDARLFKFFFPEDFAVSTDIDTVDLQGHVILCGYGRVGRLVGEALQWLKIPFVVIEYDYITARELAWREIPLIYGDAANEVVLTHAHPETASMAILALPDVFINERVARQLRRMNPGIVILARAHTNREKEILEEAGVTEVVQPETEAGLQLTWHMMAELNLPPDKIEEYIMYMLEKDYRRLSSGDHSQARLNALKLKEFTVAAGSPWIGKSLKESSIREMTGCHVIWIRKPDGHTSMNPHSSERLEAGDQVLVMGTTAQLLYFANLNSGE